MSQSSERVKAWRKATKLRMVQAMGGKCQCCGYDKCMESLDFHHINPEEKELSLGSIRANPREWLAIANELKKCILVCRNCHGELHYGQREMPEHYAEFDERYNNYEAYPELSTPCPHCGSPKAPFLQFCSMKCAATHRHSEPINWDSIDLNNLAKTNTVHEIAELIGASSGGVRKKMKKLGIPILKRENVKEKTFVPYVKAAKMPKPKVSDTDPNWRHRPNLKIRRVVRPSKEELHKMVWEKPMTSVAKDLGVSSNAVKKWCQTYDCPFPPMGYWTRREAGYSHEESLVSQKRPVKGKKFITREIAEQAFAMVQNGSSYRKAAEAFGFKHWGMQQAFQRYGLEQIKSKMAAQAGAAPA